MTKIKQIRWRLRVMMAERNITTATELGRRLTVLGVNISTQQLSRVVTEMPQRLNTELLAALMTVLDCEPNDLIEVRDAEAPSLDTGVASTNTTKPKRLRRPGIHMASSPTSVPVIEEDHVGPRVTALPRPPRRKAK